MESEECVDEYFMRRVVTAGGSWGSLFSAVGLGLRVRGDEGFPEPLEMTVESRWRLVRTRTTLMPPGVVDRDRGECERRLRIVSVESPEERSTVSVREITVS